MGKGLHRCISSPLETKDLCQDLVGFQSDIVQRKFEIKNAINLCYSYYTIILKIISSFKDPMCFEPIPRILVIV